MRPVYGISWILFPSRGVEPGFHPCHTSSVGHVAPTRTPAATQRSEATMSDSRI